MKKTIFKNPYFWTILISFIISLLIIFLWPYLFDSLKSLSSRLLVASSIFSITIISILLIIVFKKPETKEVIEQKKKRKRVRR